MGNGYTRYKLQMVVSGSYHLLHYLNHLDMPMEVYGNGWGSDYDTISIIEITGGTDATNPELIAWLEQNATRYFPKLKPILSDIANAIRTKKGTTDLIKPTKLAEEIESIEITQVQTGFNTIKELPMFTGGEVSFADGPIGPDDVKDILLIYVYGFNENAEWKNVAIEIITPSPNTTQKIAQTRDGVALLAFYTNGMYCTAINFENCEAVDNLDGWGIVQPTANNFKINFMLG
jgi:hypothetical protein